MKVWILLPAYNEARNLPPLIEGIVGVMDAERMSYGIVVVDDGSQDGTGSVARALADHLPVEVVPHKRNLGLARAMDTGLRVVGERAARDDVVVTMDADNTHPPELIPRMVAAIARGADVVIASRYAPGGREEGVPPLRRFLSAGISSLLRLRFRIPGVRDYTSGYRAYRASALERARRHFGDRLITVPGFAVMAELLVRLRSWNPQVAEVALHLRYDQKHGRSKLHIFRTMCEYSRLLVRGA